MRIATFNLESLDMEPGAEAAFERRAAVLRPQLENLAADVLCLQEVNGQHVTGKPERELTALSRLLAETRYDSYHLVASAARAAPKRHKGGVADVHNLVILSRRPSHHGEALRHRLVPPVPYRSVTAEPEAERALTLEWDRPLLHVVLETDAGDKLHVINLHLRSPLASPIPGQKLSAERWASLAGWAEGYFTATLKRSGQALEARLLVERIFDAEPQALIAVCGDLNAGEAETPSRILQARPEDSGNPTLAGRALEALELRLPEAERFTVIHGGRRRMLDHILCSPALAARCRGIEADNRNLPDEVEMAEDDPRSNHAPLVAAFNL